MAIEDKIIFNEIRKGNRQVYEALFSEYYESLVRFAQSFLFDQQQCEDLVQDLFVYVWENAKSIEIKVSIKAYFYKAIRNNCLNHLATLKVKDKKHSLYVDAVLQSGDELEMFDSQILEAIKESIEELPEQMRRVFVMKMLDGEKRESIAEELGVSLNTVKTQLQRARAKLRNTLKDKTHLMFML